MNKEPRYIEVVVDFVDRVHGTGFQEIRPWRPLSAIPVEIVDVVPGTDGSAEVDDIPCRVVLFLFVRSQILQFHLIHPPRGGLRRSAPSSTRVSCRFSPLKPIMGPRRSRKMQRLLDWV